MARKKRPSARTRQAHERGEAWGFIYCALGATRSLERVHEIVGSMSVQTALRTIERYSVAHKWIDRAEKYDEEITAAKLEVLYSDSIREVVEADAAHARLGRMMQDAAVEAMEAQSKVEQPKERTLAEIARIGQVGVDIERVASGMATQRREVMVMIWNLLIGEVAALIVGSVDALPRDMMLTDDHLDAYRFTIARGLERIIESNFAAVGEGSPHSEE